MSKIALLITMYISSTIERKKMYKLNILDWLNNTPFEIYTVDSSNRKLDIIHPRLHQYYFDQGFNQINKNPSMSEKNSILRLFDNYPELYSYNFIYKITGKYYCPNFMDQYKTIPNNVDIVLQYGIKGKLNFYIIILSIILLFIYLFINVNDIFIVILVLLKILPNEHTELVGMKPQLLKDVVQSINYFNFEITLYNYINSHTDLLTYRLKPLQIKRKTMRSDKSILNIL